jgi:ABC-type transport system involved in cytochrome c biogenesis permease component
MSKHSSSSLGNYWWSRVADTIGDWNPQLLRELKSRVSWRSVSLAVLLSIGLQVLIVINKFNKILPNINDRYQSYCKAFTGQKCAVDAMGNPVISWPTWWGDVSVDISQAMFVGLLVVGVYALASNFKQEKKRGTLNFLRLSPQKARSIIVGKLLGLPALVYLGVLCAVPLQMYAAHSAQIARANVLAWDLAMLGLGIFFYLGAVLATLWSGILPIVLTAITVPMSYTFVSLSLRWHGQYAENSVLQWYGIKFINHPLAFLLMAAMSALGIYWIYKAIEHRYHQPTGAVLSRLQSYVWSFTYHLFLLGFCTSYRYDPSTNKLADRLSFDFRLHTYVGNGSNDTVYPVFIG